MKELRYFYAPDALTTQQLPDEEANHVLRVLRLGEGDSLNITDGRGHLIEATITQATRRECFFKIVKVEKHPPLWPRRVHLAVAPTKNIDRMEWLVEKATEIGVDRITFLSCQYSERRTIKTERLLKIAVAAMKQSHKFYLPQIDEMQPFDTFVKASRCGLRFIAHCYDDADLLLPDGTKPMLLEALRNKIADPNAATFTVLVGPEGDFSVDEVRLALRQGYTPVSLGASRLRTETAALVAVHLMQLAQAD